MKIIKNIKNLQYQNILISYIYLSILCTYPASFSPGWKQLVLEFCTEGVRKNPSKDTTSLHFANGKTVELSTSPRKVAMQSMDVASYQLEVH